MARVAILSDIHGNLEALKSVVRAAQAEGVEGFWHLGDVVGYNADPTACLEMLKECGARGVQGNHDLAALDPQIAESFNVLAHEAIHYTIQQLDTGHLAQLHALPLCRTLEGALLCHGTPETPHSYILNLYQARRIFNLMRKRYPDISVCFFGHTHQHKIWIQDPRGKVMAVDVPDKSVRLSAENLYLINPGSVGQPRERDNRARFLIFDTDLKTVDFRAVPYDVQRAQEKILQAGLPEYLALRLQDGV
ncbi:MAG: metallophosphoesterase family protein [Desulfosoma sp.]|uniref:metallophosphoesterase family protein n=1 Tax=Desulfosoma sp. TaxID=2603217 RepID=UPI0040498C91